MNRHNSLLLLELVFRVRVYYIYTESIGTDNTIFIMNHLPFPVLTLRQWHDDDDGGPLLDLRASDDDDVPPRRYRWCHRRRRRDVVAIPVREIRQRSSELPPRGTPLTLLASAPDASEAMTFHAIMTTSSQQQNQRRQHDDDDDKKAGHRRRPLVPWNVVGVVLDTAENRTTAAELGLSQNDNDDDDSSFVVRPRLWEPNGLIRNALLPLLLQQQSSTTTSPSTQQPPHTEQPLEIWDLGAGAGRDAAFLAEELLQATDSAASTPNVRWKVVAMDQRYRRQNDDDDDEEPCRAFFRRRGLTAEHATCETIDLHRDAEGFLRRLRARRHRVRCLVSVRYWNPALVRALARRPDVVTTGTLVVVCHFGIPRPHGTWTHAHPKVGVHSMGVYVKCVDLVSSVAFMCYFILSLFSFLTTTAAECTTIQGGG